MIDALFRNPSTTTPVSEIFHELFSSHSFTDPNTDPASHCLDVMTYGAPKLKQPLNAMKYTSTGTQHAQHFIEMQSCTEGTDAISLIALYANQGQ